MTDLQDYKIQKNNTYETRAYQFAYYITETRQATVTTDQLIWNNLGKLIFNPIDTQNWLAIGLKHAQIDLISP